MKSSRSDCNWPTLRSVLLVMRQDLTLSPRLASCLRLPMTGILDINHHSGFLGSLHSKVCCSLTILLFLVIAFGGVVPPFCVGIQI